jgi:hypothetical protein
MIPPAMFAVRMPPGFLVNGRGGSVDPPLVPRGSGLLPMIVAVTGPTDPVILTRLKDSGSFS